MKKAIKPTFAVIFAFFICLAQLLAQDTLYADAGGFKMHMVKKGNGAGPTVIMDNGGGGGIRWGRGLDDTLAKQATVVTFDRAFLGKSGKGNTDRSGEVVAAELKLALQDADIKPPYILIGFSLGGYYIKAFARANPDDTKGLLLIDPLNTDAFYRDFKTEFSEEYHWDSVNFDPKEEDPGFHEGVFVFGDVYGDDSVPDHIPTMLLIAKAPRKTDIPEIPDWDNKKKGSQELWIRHLLLWAADYPLVKTIEVPDAGHCIHCDRMDLVLEAFNELMENITY